MKKFLTFFAIAATAISALAIPAHPLPASIAQPDGTRLTVQLIGDEFYSYDITHDGYTIVRNSAGGYEYARLDGDRLVPSGVLAHNAADRTAAERSMLSTIPTRLTDRQAAATGRAARQKRDAAAKIQRYDYTRFRGLIILVEYNDVSFTMDNPSDFYNHMANDEGYTGHALPNGGWANCTGSVRDYFNDQSLGAFKPQFDIVGPVKVNYNSTNHNRTSRSKTIFNAAVNAVNSYVNFADYDTDNDGTVDMIYFLCAGMSSSYSGNDSGYLWPHRSTFSGYTRYDGKYIRDYACSTELYGFENTPSSITIEGIGTFCHEFSHVLGLPDLYDTDYEESGQSHHPDSWDIMSGGSSYNSARTPCGYTIWERYSLGWANPPVLNAEGTYRLNPVNTHNEGFILKTPTANEFFMIENRQKTGWDAYLPGHGMTIVRVDSTSSYEWTHNQVNCYPNHNYYEMLRAGNTNSGDAASDTYPGSYGVTMIGNTTIPSLINWHKAESNWFIQKIRETDGVISFELKNKNNVKCLTEGFETMATTTNTGLKDVEGDLTKWTFTRSNVTTTTEVDDNTQVVAMKQSSAITTTEPLYYNAYQASFNVYNPTNVTAKFTLTYTVDGTKWNNAKSATGSTTQEVLGNTSRTLGWNLDLLNSQPARYRITMSAGNKNNANYVDDFVIYYTGSEGSGDKVEGDVNGDGKVDVNDVNVMINVMLGKATEPNADLTGDGTVDVQDLNKLLNIILS